MKAHADHLADAGMEAMKTFLILLVGLLNIGAHLFLTIMSFTLRSPCPIDRNSVVYGKSVDLVDRRIIIKKSVHLSSREEHHPSSRRDILSLSLFRRI